MVSLSIIIPVYKVEKYIEECLKSICNQLIDGVEIIIVNDGTPDNSMLIANEYILNNYSNLKHQFVFLNQENQGQSVARNNALKVAKGNYVGFLDSDDYLDNDYFKILMHEININQNIDIFEFNANKVDEDGNLIDFINQINNDLIINSADKLKENILNGYWYLWLRVYRRELLKNFLIPSCHLEDKVILPFIYLRSKRIKKINKNIINYRVRSGSDTNSFSYELELNKLMITRSCFLYNLNNSVSFNNFNKRLLILDLELLNRISYLNIKIGKKNYFNFYTLKYLKIYRDLIFLNKIKPFILSVFPILYLIKG